MNFINNSRSVNKQLFSQKAVDYSKMQRATHLKVNGEPAKDVDYYIFAGEKLNKQPELALGRNPKFVALCKEVRRARAEGHSKEEIWNELQNKLVGGR